MKIFCLIFVFVVLNIEACLAKIRADCACGESNAKTSGRIVNGKTTTANKYPWMAGMFRFQTFMCGGAIISDKTILTAAHCLFYIPDPLSTYWVLGMHDQINKDGVIYTTNYYELHPKFKNLSFYDDYDVALVTVAKKIHFTKTIKPICLPSPDADYTGKAGTVSGWGKLNDGRDGVMASHLQEVKIRVKPTLECTIATRRILNFNPSSMLCGQEYMQDACQGDSGGPFFIETDPNRYEVFGVVSFGDGCASSFPGIYGRIAEPFTLKWIKHYNKGAGGDLCRDPFRKSPHNLFNEISRLFPLQ